MDSSAIALSGDKIILPLLANTPDAPTDGMLLYAKTGGGLRMRVVGGNEVVIPIIGTGASEAAAGNHTHSIYVPTGSILTSGLTISATNKLLGRVTTGSGAVEEITCTAAGRALLDDADASVQRTTLGLGSLATQSGTFSGTSSGTNTGDQTITLTGNVTGSGTGSFATTIANSAVTYAKIQNVSATDKLLGRSTSGSGVVEEITCTAAGRALLDDVDAAAQRTTLGLGTAATSAATDFATANHTHANLDIVLSVPAVDGGAVGIKETVTISETNGVAVGDLLYQKNTGYWGKASAGASGTMPGLRIALAAAANGATCSTLAYGYVYVTAWSWVTVGGMLYASAATPGQMTQTAPSAMTNQVQVLGIARSANVVFFNPSLVLAEVK